MGLKRRRGVLRQSDDLHSPADERPHRPQLRGIPRALAFAGDGEIHATTAGDGLGPFAKLRQYLSPESERLAALKSEEFVASPYRDRRLIPSVGCQNHRFQIEPGR